MRRNRKNKMYTTVYLSERKESFHNSKIARCESFDGDKTAMKLVLSSEPENRSSPCKMNKEYDAKKKSHGWNNKFKSSTHDTLVGQTEIAVTPENEHDETKKMDETYELSEPETPTLRQILKGKRNAKKNNLNIKSEKKHLRVHFKDAMLGTSLPSIVTKASSEKNMLTSSINIFRKRTNFVDDKISSSIGSYNFIGYLYIPDMIIVQFYWTSNSFTCISICSRLFKFKYKFADSKFLATKEVPNFAEIHKRMFGKLESVVDAKKRLEDRHTTLTTVKLNKSMSLRINSEEKDRLLDKPNKSAYNQLGFKIKKQEAVECILRNNSIQSARNKVQQQNRAILKGVRTNRRFELQMKARNLIL